MEGSNREITLRAVIFFATSFIWLTSQCSAAQCELFPDAIDPVREQIANLEENVPSLFQVYSIGVYSVAVVYRNTTVYSTGLVDTPFRIGSITKIFTAMGALMLRQRGRLSLDDPVTKFLPSFSIINPFDDHTKPYDAHATTLRELMGHLSGLPRNVCLGAVCGSKDEEENLRTIAGMRMVRQPWTFLPVYSNLGFTVLGHAWEKATSPRQTWSEFVRTEILKPLEMHDSGADLAGVKLAPGHIDSHPSNTSRGWRGPDGEMYSTALDLAQFLKFMLRPDPALLSTSAVREWMHPTTVVQSTTTSGWTGYAMPWELMPLTTSAMRSSFLFTKNGVIGTYLSLIGFHPETQLGVAILTSSENATSAMVSIIMRQILELWAGF